MERISEFSSYCVCICVHFISFISSCVYVPLSVCVFVLKGFVYLRVYGRVSEPVCLIGLYKHTETQAVESGQAS